MTSETTTTRREPCKPGTEIEYCGMSAVVVHDDGGERVRVRCEGHEQDWRWTFEGEECCVMRVPVGELFYDTFDAYVADFPDGERFRAWATSNGTRNTFLLRDTLGSGQGLPGDYHWGSLTALPDRVLLSCHDSDDGLVQRNFRPDEMAQAEQVVSDLKKLAPLSMADMVDMLRFNRV